MNGVLKSAVLLGIALTFGSHLPAQGSASQGLIRCKASELDQHPIKDGNLSLTISRFKQASFKVSVQNSSENFSPFSPDDLTVIGSDGSHYYIEVSYIHIPGRSLLPTPVKIGPKAHLLLTYGLNGEVNLPARIFYAGKLVAEITK